MILMFTFGILITLTVLVGAFLFSVSTQILGSGGSLTAAEALWVAEGGLQQVYYQLYSDAGFRNSPTSPVTGSLGTGTYSVTVSKSGTTYTLSSTGTVSSFNRRITRTVIAAPTWANAFNYAAFGGSGTTDVRLRNQVQVSGDFYSNADVVVDVNAGITGGLVYADSITGAGTYTAAGGLPNPVPSYPSFDTSTYDAAITIADALTADLTLSGSSNLNLAGGTVYYDNVTIRNSATVTGPGTIVAGNNTIIEDSAIVGSNVTLITKSNVTVRNTAVVQSGGVLYAGGNVNLRNSASVTGSLLAPGSGDQVSLHGDAVLTGIIYGDVVDLQDDAVVTGSVVADTYQGDDINNRVDVNFSAASRPSTIPTGLGTGTNATMTLQADWTEP